MPSSASLTNARVRLTVAGIIWRDRARRARARLHRGRHVLAQAALVVAGLGGGLAGGALVGEWCLGVVLVAESGGALWFGLMRDDGTGLPRRGARTVEDILEAERLRPDPGRVPAGPQSWTLP